MSLGCLALVGSWCLNPSLTLHVRAISAQYSIDLYNEMNPSSNDPAYLHSVSSAVYAALQSADPDAVWVMQVRVLLGCCIACCASRIYDLVDLIPCQWGSRCSMCPCMLCAVYERALNVVFTSPRGIRPASVCQPPLIPLQFVTLTNGLRLLPVWYMVGAFGRGGCSPTIQTFGGRHRSRGSCREYPPRP